MSLIRELKPRVEPPKDRPVQFFFKNGTAGIYAANDRELVGVVAWCLPAQLDGTTSGPVHSLEAQELPAPSRPVLIRVSNSWLVGHQVMRKWRAHRLNGTDHCEPDAWRPLPDDEPGDEELLEAARRWAETYEDNAIGHRDNCRRLSDVVKKRGGK